MSVRRVEMLLCRALLLAYPPGFRARFGADLLADYERLAPPSGVRRRLAGWWRLLRDTARAAPREHARAVRRRGGPLRFLGGLPGEVRGAAAGLRKARGFSVLVIATLALGMAPTTAIYSLANWLLLRPVAGVPSSDGLGVVMFGEVYEGGMSPNIISYPNVLDAGAGLSGVEALGGYHQVRVTIASDDQPAEQYDAEIVQPSYFEALRLRPVSGRLFTTGADDPATGGEFLAVVSYRFASARTANVAELVGTLLTVNRLKVEVTGILPPGFHGADGLGRVDLWLPGATYGRLQHRGPDYRMDDRARGFGYYQFVVRRADDVSWSHVEEELNGSIAGLVERYPTANERLRDSRFVAHPGIGYPALGRAAVRRSLWLLAAVAGCVLLVACANAASLLFVRALERRGEVAMLKALGATNTRIVRGQFIETLLLCLLGSLFGLVLTTALLRLFEGVRLRGMFQGLEGVQVDVRVMVFALILTSSVALIASILPAARCARTDPAAWLARLSRGSTRAGHRWHRAMLVVQLAAVVPLLGGALLFGLTLRSLQALDLGFEPGTVRVLGVSFSGQGYDGSATLLYQRQLRDALAEAPEVDRFALCTGAPYVGTRFISYAKRPDQTTEEWLELDENAVSAGYFDLLSIPLLAGRTFAEEEVLSGDEAGNVVIISAATANRLFGEESAIGREIHLFSFADTLPLRRVVGVVGDVERDQMLAGGTVYVPLGTDDVSNVQLTVLVDGVDPGAARESAIAAGKQLDPLLPLLPDRYTPGLAEGRDDALSERVMLSRLFVVLGLVGVLLAAVGLYGATSRAVLAQRREIGVRMALGASLAQTCRRVLGDALQVALLGAAIGGGLAWYGSRLIESRLHGVTALDPRIWLTALAGVLLVAACAAALPARSAARTNPAETLRS